jgi:signal transduction histidine kinase
MVVYINDFLDVTRLQTGKLIIRPAFLSVEKVVSKAIASISPTAQKKQILLTHQIEPDMPELQIDEKRMMQVLINLLSNALKFTPKGGEVCVKVSQDPNNSEFILVSVSDTGRGIEPEHLERIFERLYQVHNSDSMTDGGLGLGLNICKELVNLHGGKIWVKSQPGGGSIFFFTIPKHLPKKTINRLTEKGERDEKDSHN